MKATEVEGAELPLLKLADVEKDDESGVGLIDYGAGPDTPPGTGPKKARYIKWRRTNTGTGSKYCGYEEGLLDGDGPVLFTVQKCATTERWSLLVGKDIPGTWGWPCPHDITHSTATGCKWAAEMYWRPNPVSLHEPSDVADEQHEQPDAELDDPQHDSQRECGITTRTNRCSGVTVPLTAAAAERYDTIMRLALLFEESPPYIDRPFDSAILRLWERLKEEFYLDWPDEYRTLID